LHRLAIIHANKRPPADEGGLSKLWPDRHPELADGCGDLGGIRDEFRRRRACRRRRVDAMHGSGPLDEPGSEGVRCAHHLRERVAWIVAFKRHDHDVTRRGLLQEGALADADTSSGFYELLVTWAVQLFHERAPLGGLSGQDRVCGCHQRHEGPPWARACPATEGRTRHWPCATVLATVYGRRAGESPTRLPASLRWSECRGSRVE